MRLFVVGSEYVVCCARVTRRDTNKDKRGGGEKKERKIFHSKSKHKIFTSSEFFFKLEFHHNLFFVYIFVLF